VTVLLALCRPPAWHFLEVMILKATRVTAWTESRDWRATNLEQASVHNGDLAGDAGVLSESSPSSATRRRPLPLIA
jgi:hypothetical protein